MLILQTQQCDGSDSISRSERWGEGGGVEEDGGLLNGVVRVAAVVGVKRGCLDPVAPKLYGEALDI
jgi:hypothetical protein